MRKEIISIAILGLFLLIGISPSIGADSASRNVVKPLTMGITITVDDDRVQCPNADYTSLNEAMDYANGYGNDVSGVDVYPGEYLVGPVGENGIGIYEPDLYLRGVGGALNTVIDGEGWITLGIYDNNVEVSGFTIKSTDSVYWPGVVVGKGEFPPTYFADNVKIHDCIFDLPYSNYVDYTVYGLILSSYCSNAEIYNNDFICDEENAADSGGVNHNWHNNFWEDWDGMWDNGTQGTPYERNGVYDSSPYWDPYVLSRPSNPTVVEKRIFFRLYKYTIVSTDADGDGLYYDVQWGDDGWEWDGYPEEGFLPQGEPVTAKHRFKLGQKHIVTVYVLDEHDLWNREPTVLKVNLPRNRGISYSIMFERLMARFPVLNKFLSFFFTL